MNDTEYSVFLAAFTRIWDVTTRECRINRTVINSEGDPGMIIDYDRGDDTVRMIFDYATGQLVEVIIV